MWREIGNGECRPDCQYDGGKMESGKKGKILREGRRISGVMGGEVFQWDICGKSCCWCHGPCIKSYYVEVLGLLGLRLSSFEVAQRSWRSDELHWIPIGDYERKFLFLFFCGCCCYSCLILSDAVSSKRMRMGSVVSGWRIRVVCRHGTKEGAEKTEGKLRFEDIPIL